MLFYDSEVGRRERCVRFFYSQRKHEDDVSRSGRKANSLRKNKTLFRRIYPSLQRPYAAGKRRPLSSAPKSRAYFVLENPVYIFVLGPGGVGER